MKYDTQYYFDVIDQRIQPDSCGTGCQRLLAYLLNGWAITPLVSWQRLGIYRLAARIHDLKRDGWEIQSTMQSVQNRFGEKIQVAEYRLKNISRRTRVFCIEGGSSNGTR